MAGRRNTGQRHRWRRRPGTDTEDCLQCGAVRQRRNDAILGFRPYAGGPLVGQPPDCNARKREQEGKA